ncbi:MAG TPA: TetR/AcrR family transcriptional regulator [Candidatus Anoxymicrobiaceae bacterium]
MSKPRRRMSREDRKRDILRVAADVFASSGYRPTTVDYLVEEAGVSKGLFYIYFDSKKQAFIEVIESYFNGFAGVLEENHKRLEDVFARGDGAIEILKVWRRNVADILQYHIDNPSLTFVVYQEALGSDDDFSDRMNELTGRANSMIVEEFQMMVDAGVIRNVDIEFAAAVSMGSIVYIIMDLLLQKKWTDVESLADMIVGYHSRALALPNIDMDRLLSKVIAPRPSHRKKSARH